MSFLDFFGARYLLKFLVITATISSYVVLAVCLNNLLEALTYNMPDWLSAAGWVLPYNLAECLSALMTGSICRWAYDYQRSRLAMVGNG